MYNVIASFVTKLTVLFLAFGISGLLAADSVTKYSPEEWEATAGIKYDEERKEALRLTAECRSCHGFDGMTPMFEDVPVIGHQSKAYLKNALNQYRNGQRQPDINSSSTGFIMRMVVGALSEDAIDKIAGYFAAPRYYPNAEAPLENPREGLENGKTILLYGASGQFGRAMTREALDRGYKVIGVSRRPEKFNYDHPRFIPMKGDVTDMESVKKLVTMKGVDVVVSAASSGPSNTDMSKPKAIEDMVQVIAAKNIASVLKKMGEKKAPRFIQVGGATSLLINGEHALEVFAKNPMMVGPMPPPGSVAYNFFQANYESLKVLRATKGVKWTHATPAWAFDMGPRTGKFRWGEEEMLFHPDTGMSRISRADLAVAICNEIIAESYVKKRFTVSY